MNDRAKIILTYFALIVVSLFFLFSGLVYAKSFLAPLSLAALLSMVLLPICRWFERKGISRGWASLFSDLIILLFFVLLAGIVATEVKSLAQQWPQIKERLSPKIDQLQEFIEDKTGLSVQEQNQRISSHFPGGSSGSGQPGTATNQQQPQAMDTVQPSQGGSSGQQSGGSMLSSAGSFVSQFFSFLGSFLLTFIYIFFFLLYRSKFRKSILKMVPEEKKGLTRQIISESIDVSQNYLFGRLILIIFLAILYAIGLSISGIKHAILISLLAAVLSLVPYIGNIVGYLLAIGMALFSGSGAMGAIGVTITFAITQFIESYALEPYVVGDKVNLNPVFTIIVVVLGGAIWGVVGMLIAIPTLGILKVIFDRIPVLQPLGYLFGEEDIGDKEKDQDNFFEKVKGWVRNMFKK